VKDLRRRLADPAALAIWIGIPLLLGGLMSFVAGGDAAPPRAKVLVVDQDDSLLTALLAGSSGASSGQGGLPIDLETVSLEDGRRRIDEGDATALLVLPEGFQEAVLQDTPTRIELVTNPAEQILPRIVEEALEILVEAVFYGQQLFGPTLRRLAATATSGAPSDAQVASISVEINQQLARLQNVLIPPVITVTAATESEGEESLSFGQLFLPGMLLMSILFIAQGMSSDIWQEQRKGTLRRALTTPQSPHRLLAGKLTAGMMLMAAVTAAGLIAASAVFDVSWTRIPLALLWCAFAGAAILAYLTLLQTFATSERGGEMLAGMIVFPLMMIGGSFFPFEAMPSWMAAVGQWTPNGLAVARLKDLLYGTPSPASFAVPIAAIGAPAAAAMVLAGVRLRSRFAAA
jgi:ABC-type multidrug transport system permease subunit